MDARPPAKLDVVASNLLFASLAVGVAVSYGTKTGVFANDFKTSPATAAALTIAVPFLLVQYYAIRKGERWAKISYVAFAGLSVLFTFLDFKGVTAKLDTPASAAIFVVQYLVQLAVMVMILQSLRGVKPAAN
ncbi:hypothetical protein [Hymenobacter coccineus]|uniref:EamA domain-containing protein n=1 Tax=Hymenobacter coccineus TaxID=1908235 RepID=A0A1G1T8V0_9BACT|nr:hypothetical protein [Hymenobacter coccineus]OGX87298.1 hypothetical protein BEN49_10695 [Hymenobacter coccineus]